MTVMTTRQAWSQLVGAAQVRPFHVGRYFPDPCMVAGRPAPPGR
jgi:hypothetical protein